MIPVSRTRKLSEGPSYMIPAVQVTGRLRLEAPPEQEAGIPELRLGSQVELLPAVVILGEVRVFVHRQSADPDA